MTAPEAAISTKNVAPHPKLLTTSSILRVATIDSKIYEKVPESPEAAPATFLGTSSIESSQVNITSHIWKAQAVRHNLHKGKSHLEE